MDGMTGTPAEGERPGVPGPGSLPDYHMSVDDFRRHGKQLVDWIADYWRDVESLPILPQVSPGDLLAALPEAAPEAPEPFEAVIADLDRIVRPGLTHWQSPGWFAFFPANASFPSILGELVAAGLAQQGMLWSTSPATTEVESRVLDWMVDLLGLPEEWRTTGSGGGVIQMSASDSSHAALVVARRIAEERGPLDRMVAYASSQAHSSIEKGARVAGYGHIRLVGVDDRFAMSVAALERAVSDDAAAGLVPAFVCSAVGTTGTTAVDPVRQVGEVARRHGMWHHVDAAYAGSAMVCEEFRHHQDGLELADSYTFNPHKWMFTNFDCSVLYVADRRSLIETLSILPPYLRDQASESGSVIDYRDWHVPLGRRFRALKLWFVLRQYGAEGLRHHIRQHVAMARDLEARIVAHPRLEPVAPTPFALVSFAHVDGHEATLAVARAVNASGHSYVTTSEVGGRAFVRVVVGQTHTRQEHVDRLWDVIDRST
jgi:aromatic-L-amino-acid/L-tryptophan decarboxylase